MKKILPIFILLLGVTTGLHAATPVTVNTSSSQEMVCDGANVNDYWYVGQTHYPRDRFVDGNDKDWLFGMVSSYVKIYNPYNFFQVNGGWNWRSNGKPKGVSEVIIMQNDGGSVVTNHTANPSDLVAQITYRINRKYSKNLLPGTTTISYTDMGYNYLSQSINRFDSEIVGDNECVNIYARWCGDGIVSHGEQCDGTAGLTAGQSCTSTCQITTTSPDGFDLSIKKYAKSEDVFASVEPTENYNYTIVVRNNGTGAVTNTTTVSDRLPAPITLRAAPSGNGWTCTGADGASEFTCTTTRSYPANTEFDVITVPVKVNNLAFRASAYTNYAYVSNPDEVAGKRCNANNATPNPSLGGANGETPTAVCSQDKNNFDPATVSPPNPNGFDLKLKKLVNGDDESSAVRPGATATYTFTVQNLGELASTGTTTVTDESFPAGVTIATMASTQGEWSCTVVTVSKFICTSSKSYAKGEFATPIVLTASIAATQPVGLYPNVACLSNPSDPHEATVLDPSTGKYKVNNCDPANVVIVPANSFDLSLKKYVADTTSGTPLRDGDHQTTNDGIDVDRDILSIAQGGKVRYRFVVKNEGPVTATGTTTVEDTLPNGFIIAGTPAGTGWTCSVTGNGSRSFVCTRTTELAVGAFFPDIVVDAATDAAILAGEYSNTATVKNPGDTNPNNNTDPANVEVLVGARCGGITLSTATLVAPGTTTTYTCSALGYTGAVTDLEYQINCGTATGSWSSSATGTCVAPSTSSMTQAVTCGVRARQTPAVIFTGSFIGSCSAAITTTGGGGGGGVSNVGKKCVNGIASCALYNSLAACEAELGVGNCDSADAAGQARCQAKPLSCGGGGGGGGGGGVCGDGVLQVGEECDVVGATWCTACKIDILTNPGANPITDLWMTIPTLSRARLGYSWLDGVPGKIAFSDNKMVLGVGTRAFTLADSVGFGIKQKYMLPLIVEADKKICLTSKGVNISSNTLCTKFGALADASMKFTVPGTTKEYVLIGNGEYQVRQTNGTYEKRLILNNPNNITLFRGAKSYALPTGGNVRLAEAFVGKSIGNDGRLSLYHLSESNGEPIDLVALDVRVSSALVGATSSTVTRKITAFMSPTSIVDTFLSGFKSYTPTTVNTTAVSKTPIKNVVVAGNTTGNKTVQSVADLESLAVNGNKNILTLKNGTLTIEDCGVNGLLLTGVRTVIVEGGDIIFRCNVGYGSSDTTSSWAWIAKGGNIVISTNVTNLAGVYVTIPDGAQGGKFTSQNGTTTNILRLDGSMYGNADGLFSSRLYVRGTNAYDILTTGVILSYSNRALANPPPLLSEYLNNYSVTRVAK